MIPRDRPDPVDPTPRARAGVVVGQVRRLCGGVAGGVCDGWCVAGFALGAVLGAEKGVIGKSEGRTRPLQTLNP